MISRRYEILDEIGQGAMGVVYGAFDRLTGHEVALKRVMPSTLHLDGSNASLTRPPTDADGSSAGAVALAPRQPGDTTIPDITDVTLASSGSPGSTSDTRLALAREFRILSSLSHPNIIRVLDYGFEDRILPFYTMDRLAAPETVLEAGQGRALELQVSLVVQMLQALAYLHRRGIIHRDVKPSNALVEGDRVKLVDFGISELREQSMGTEGITGTIAYMAPELLRGQKATEASDLFALGVVAFEMLTGRHPFDARSLTLMMVNISKGEEPDCEGLDERLQPVIRRLLRKELDERYARVSEVIRDLTAALDLPLPEETAAIRDSFLESAKLVGRRREMTALAEHLAQSIAGLGKVVLVGGESGVGKTRLLDELRTLALVKGVFVVEGQEVRRGKSPYQVWREPMRHL
ncbi:MAG: serine/threonine-protein kinase, partial [Holophagales bacterium]|nr:serine/threonine-protein kinase [Holophagales bacterium]